MSDVSNRTILLVEDNDDDVFVMKRALKFAQIMNPLQIATDGQKALDYLSGAGEFGERDRHPLPFIVFLDLKLPYIDGFEILHWLRVHPELSWIVVVVLSSSPEERDQERAYSLGAKSYLVKPPTPDGLKDVFNALKSHLV